MTDPTITFSMHVGSFGVALLVTVTGAGFAAARTAAAFIAALDLS
jgi:hypothetical protein